VIRLHHGALGLEVLGMDHRRERSPAQLVTRGARHRAERLVGIEDAPVQIGDRHPDRRVLERAAQALLQAALLGDVAGDAERSDGGPGRVAERAL
jgi:hypothetical protein